MLVSRKTRTEFAVVVVTPTRARVDMRVQEGGWHIHFLPEGGAGVLAGLVHLKGDCAIAIIGGSWPHVASSAGREDRLRAAWVTVRPQRGLVHSRLWHLSLALQSQQWRLSSRLSSGGGPRTLT